MLVKLTNFYLPFNASLRLRLHGVIYRPDSFVLISCYCANLNAIRYESTNLNRIVADKLHRVIVALQNFIEPVTHGITQAIQYPQKRSGFNLPRCCNN